MLIPLPLLPVTTYLERRKENETQKQADKICATAQESQTVGDQASPSEVAFVLSANCKELEMSWEYDFSPNYETNTCPHCGQVHIADAGVSKELYNGKENITLLFCSTQCSWDYYLNKLRGDL